MKTRLLAAAAVTAAFSSQPATADESLWMYAKGTDTLPEGKMEVKINMTSRRGKNFGDYTFNDIRPEFEYGINSRLTVSVEAMIFDHNYSVSDPELNPMFETQGGAGQRFNDTQLGGYEIGLKYNLLSPYIDPVGVTVGLAYERRDKYRLDGANIDQDSFVTSLLLQKDFLDDTLIFVFNAKAEFERRKSPDFDPVTLAGVLEEEIAFDLSAAVSYRFAPRWYVGLEWRHQSDFLNPQEDGEFNPELKRSSFDLGDFRIGSRHQYGAYLGPTLHYGTQNWWVTAGILWQIKGGGSQFAFNSSGRNWDEHEKVHAGLTFARQF